MLYLFDIFSWTKFRLLFACEQGKAAVKTTVAAGVISLAMPLTMQMEGLRLKAYLDIVGVPTICYGETENVELGDVRTKEECDVMLAIRLAYYAWQVQRAIGTELPEATHAALASWTYNVGVEAMRNSRLVFIANGGDLEAACNQLPRWVYAKGKKLNGLVRRREIERELCLRDI